MFFTHYWAGILWALLILVLSLLPPSRFPETDVKELDKFAHIFLYSVLVFLFFVTRFRKRTAIWTGAFFYGLGIELLQGALFVKRTFETTDVIANAMGCLLGLAFCYLFLWKTGKVTNQ